MSEETKGACEHVNFNAFVSVNRLTDSGKFAADIKIRCTDCGHPFCFRGLPLGLDLNGAAMSPDGREARLAIYPQGEFHENDTALAGFRVMQEN
jgi:hypothetical protein